VREKKEGKIPNLEITLRKEINALFISRHILKANYQSGATGWPDRLPAEVPSSIERPNPVEKSPIPTRAGNGDFSSAVRGGWIRRKPEFGPMTRSVRDYTPR